MVLLYIRNIFNSLVVATSVSVTTVLLSAMAGYGLAKLNLKVGTPFSQHMATMMIVRSDYDSALHGNNGHEFKIPTLG